MMQNLETEIAKTTNEYTLCALLYHVIVSYLPMEPRQARDVVIYDFTEESKQQYYQLVDYAVRIFNATHQEQTTYEEMQEMLIELSNRYHIAASKDTMMQP